MHKCTFILVPEDMSASELGGRVVISEDLLASGRRWWSLVGLDDFRRIWHGISVQRIAAVYAVLNEHAETYDTLDPIYVQV